MNALIKKSFNRCVYTFLVISACATIQPSNESKAMLRSGAGKLGGAIRRATSTTGSLSSSLSGSRRSVVSSSPSKITTSTASSAAKSKVPSISTGGATGGAVGKISHKYGVNADGFKGLDLNQVDPTKKYVQFQGKTGELLTFEKSLGTRIGLLLTKDEVGIESVTTTSGKTYKSIYRTKPNWVKGQDIITSGLDKASISSVKSSSSSSSSVSANSSVSQAGVKPVETTTTTTATIHKDPQKPIYTSVAKLKVSGGKVSSTTSAGAVSTITDTQTQSQSQTAPKPVPKPRSKKPTSTQTVISSTSQGVQTKEEATPPIKRRPIVFTKIASVDTSKKPSSKGETSGKDSVKGATSSSKKSSSKGISSSSKKLPVQQASTSSSKKGDIKPTTSGTGGDVTVPKDITYFQKEVKVNEGFANDLGNEGFVNTAKKLYELKIRESKKPLVSNKSGEIDVTTHSSNNRVGVSQIRATGRNLITEPGKIENYEPTE